MIMKVGDFYWPLADIHGREAITRDCDTAIEAILPHIAGRDSIVQAGANVGIYPIALADHFGHVVTAEPDFTNYECLLRNVGAHGSRFRIHTIDAAFGAAIGRCQPREVHPHNCGAHRVEFVERGPQQVLTIDSLGLPACDCIWLDVEGSELFALQGAEQTIERFSPTIAVEDKGLDHEFFGVPQGALQAWLGERGYAEVARIGRDKIFTRTR